MRQKKPLIYFFGIIPGVYVPQWPVFLTQDNMANLGFTLAFPPDFIIKVCQGILEETDGPMLKYGIQSLNDNKIILPSSRNNWPDRDRLAQRFDAFRQVG